MIFRMDCVVEFSVAVMETEDLRGRVAQALSGLPNMLEPGQRRALLDFAGFGEIASRVDFAGSAVAFVTGLLETLVAGGGSAQIVRFLEQVASTAPMGEDRRAYFRVLAAEVSALPQPEQAAVFAWRATPQLAAMCRLVTEREIAELGSKYIRSLYYEREPVAARIAEFLISEATCFLVVSKPGRGKTSMLCHMAEMLREERDVLLFSGRTFIADSSGLLGLVASRLGYGEDWRSCLTDLARARDPLILLDAINEAPVRPELMREALHELLRHAQQAGVKVVITCRTEFWQFYRAGFWSSYMWRHPGAAEIGGRLPRGEDLPPFELDRFDEIKLDYFAAFDIRGDLIGEAADRCRHPLVLRLFCEAHRGTDIGSVDNMRIYRLLKLFWQRKIDQVVDVAELRRSDAVSGLVLAVARRMREQGRTTVVRDELLNVFGATTAELDKSDSLYSRILDEEIILEESVDDELGVRNVVFVYDRFAEYVISLAIYLDQQWDTKDRAEIFIDIDALLEDEQRFHSLRGSLEFLVLRLEDRRADSGIHIDVIRHMLSRDWKWRRIGTLLAFQLELSLDSRSWDLIEELARDQRDFVRRLVADQVGSLMPHDRDRVLSILIGLLEDANRFVRTAARRELLRLDSSCATLAASRLLARGLPSLAAEVMLWPMEPSSPLVADKLSRLAPGGELRAAVLDHLRQQNLRPWGGLLLLEQWVEDCADADVEEVLEAQRTRMDVMLTWLRQACESIDQVVAVLDRNGVELGADFSAMLAPLESVVTSEQRLAVRSELERMTTFQRVLSWDTIGCALQLIRPLSQPLWVVGDFSNSDYLDIWRVRHEIDAEQVRMPLAELVDSYAGDCHEREQLALDSLDRLSLWVWARRRDQQRRVDNLEAQVAAARELPEKDLRARLEGYEQYPLAEALKVELRDELTVICHAVDADLAMLARIVAPLLGWHEERDTTVADELLAHMRKGNDEAFWRLAQALLANDDSFAVDAMSRAVELAEAVDSDVEEILGAIGEMIEEVAGIPMADIHLNADFVNDLDIDSLSMVELAVMGEDRFGIRISDDVLPLLRTVQDAVDFVLENRREHA
jgi:acyl carrier protein